MSVRDEATATKLQQELTALLSRGGFRLTKWSSSSCEVLLQIPNQLIWTLRTCRLNVPRGLPWKQIPLDSLSPRTSQPCQNVAFSVKYL